MVMILKPPNVNEHEAQDEEQEERKRQQQQVETMVNLRTNYEKTYYMRKPTYSCATTSQQVDRRYSTTFV
jgi:hypothetical protein